MKTIRCAAQKGVMVAAAILAVTTQSFAQSNNGSDSDALTRGGAGVRVGVWNVAEPEIPATTFKSTPHVEVYFQRGLDEHIALESSVGIWRRTATRTELSGNQVETDTYVFPLFTEIRIYPFTTLDNRIEPFVSGGIGFALGLDDIGSNAIGGGGTIIVTGFGFRGGAGFDLHVTSTLGLQAAARFQWLRYGEPLGGADLFNGFGLEGGITYRLQL